MKTKLKKKTKRNKTIKSFPEYCTGFYRKNPEAEKTDCPRCGNALPPHTVSLSWDGETEICPACGNLESFGAMIYKFKAYDPYRGNT